MVVIRTNSKPKPMDAETARAVRVWLERAANKVESMSGNQVYKGAWKKAAATIRHMKPD